MKPRFITTIIVTSLLGINTYSSKAEEPAAASAWGKAAEHGAEKAEAKSEHSEEKKEKPKKSKKNKKAKKASESEVKEEVHSSQKNKESEELEEIHVMHPKVASATKLAPPVIIAENKEDRSLAGEGASLHSSSGKENVNEFKMDTLDGCFNVEFQETPGSVISCTEELPIKYTKRSCADSKLMEVGKVNASVSCENNRKIHVSFRHSTGAVKATLRIKRESDGKAGYIIKYLVIEEGKLDISLKTLNEPEILPNNEIKPEEAPLKTLVSGFAFTEFENLKNFGSSNKNFNSASGDGSGKSDLTFLSNIAIEFSKDRTKLNTLLEVGEIYYGGGGVNNSATSEPSTTDSGGAQGARGRILEVRNIYLNHEYSERLSFKSGLMTINSDPRGFIFSDHIAAIQAEYKSDLTDGMIWFGKASSASNRGSTGFGSSNTLGKNYYAGFNSAFPVSSAFKLNLYGLSQFKNTQTWVLPDGNSTSVTPSTFYGWLGSQLEFNIVENLTLQLNGIYNKTKVTSGSYSDKNSAYLADTKLSYTNPNSSFSLSAEALMTSGSSGATSGGNSIMGSNKGFHSSVDTSYLLTLATSDGVDDAPGAPRSGTIAPMSQTEGLELGVLTASMTFTKRTSGFLRYGNLRTHKVVDGTNSRNLGSEYDLSVVHQLNPSTQVQFDAAMLTPGSATGLKDKATLAATKFRFSF